MEAGFKRLGLVLALGAAALCPRVVSAIPVFARVYDQPCGACHTVFPQLNPAGERFRAHGMRGLPPAVRPLEIAGLEVPGTLPIALYLRAGENVTRVDEPGRRTSTRTRFNLDYLSLLAGGEIGRWASFLVDYELIEMERDSNEVEIHTLPHQAYAVVHAERWKWLFNLKGGWYELPLGVSPDIHRLSVRDYLAYGLTGCTLLDGGEDGECEDLPNLADTQIGLEVNGFQPARGVGWSAGFTNGSNYRLDRPGSLDFNLRGYGQWGASRLGFLLYFSPDTLGPGVTNRTLRFGPDLDLYTRQFRLLAQLLGGYESDPVGHAEALWYWGSFVEVNYRWRTSLVSLLRVEFAGTPRFDDRAAGGDTRAERRVWEVTAGTQWLLLRELKLVAELTYGESHDRVGDERATIWAGTLRLVTAFWPLTPPPVLSLLTGGET